MDYNQFLLANNLNNLNFGYEAIEKVGSLVNSKNRGLTIVSDNETMFLCVNHDRHNDICMLDRSLIETKQNIEGHKYLFNTLISNKVDCNAYESLHRLLGGNKKVNKINSYTNSEVDLVNIIKKRISQTLRCKHVGIETNYVSSTRPVVKISATFGNSTVKIEVGKNGGAKINGIKLPFKEANLAMRMAHKFHSDERGYKKFLETLKYAGCEILSAVNKDIPYAILFNRKDSKGILMDKGITDLLLLFNVKYIDGKLYLVNDKKGKFEVRKNLGTLKSLITTLDNYLKDLKDNTAELNIKKVSNLLRRSLKEPSKFINFFEACHRQRYNK